MLTYADDLCDDLADLEQVNRISYPLHRSRGDGLGAMLEEAPSTIIHFTDA